MSSRTLLLIALSVVFGLGAAWMANTWLTARLNVGGDNMENVVVAAMEIPFGQMVEPQQVKLVQMPKGAAPADAFSSVEQATGRIATMTLLQGDILREARLAEHLGGSTLASLIAPNKRAISVRVDDVVGVGGFLLPGNRVDVLVAKTTHNNDAQAETILYDLRVLAVDQTASTDKTQPVVVRAVTLEMTSEEAEKLVKGQSEGRLQLALRNPLDEDKGPKEEVASAPVVAPVPVAKPVVRRIAAPAPVRITIIRGTSIENLSMPR